LYLWDRCQIPENTDWAVSGTILAIVFVWTLSSWLSYICATDTWEYRLSRIRINIGYGIRVDLEFLIKLYLNWYRSESSFRSRAFTTYMLCLYNSMLKLFPHTNQIKPFKNICAEVRFTEWLVCFVYVDLHTSYAM